MPRTTSRQAAASRSDPTEPPSNPQDSFPGQPVAPIWLMGPAGSGKTTALLGRLAELLAAPTPGKRRGASAKSPSALAASRLGPTAIVFAATGDNRLVLADRIAALPLGRGSLQTFTPMSFFEAEVRLYWPLLAERLGFRALFPLRLRSETEQELARQLWQPALARGDFGFAGLAEGTIVRRILDFLLLAASAGIKTEDIGDRLADLGDGFQGETCSRVTARLLDWRAWCWERGILSYGLLMELYGQYLLPDRVYRGQLRERFAILAADDVDEYPPIVADLFDVWLTAGQAILSYNPDGAVRLGFGADPDRLAQLADRCEVIALGLQALAANDLELQTQENSARSPLPQSQFSRSQTIGRSQDHRAALWHLVQDGEPWGAIEARDSGQLGESLGELGPFRILETPSRAQLLRQVAETIATAIQRGDVRANQIAIVGPGVDPIARYVLIEVLGKQGIRVDPLTEQRPIINAPMVRALLTLMALVYPGLGRLIDRDRIADMLVLLSRRSLIEGIAAPQLPEPELIPRIDPVRAGLIADYCYAPDVDRPQLLDIQEFPRWDRLGALATASYNELRHWIALQQQQLEQRLISSPLILLDRAVQAFLWNGSCLPYPQLAALRELLEAAQHYWDLESRLRPDRAGQPSALARFIELLQSNVVTANPYPAKSINQVPGVTLATLFQYRINRLRHNWVFWLDAGSAQWLTGASGLFGANCFLEQPYRESLADRLSESDPQLSLSEEGFRRELMDLLSRSGERVYLCHSELDTQGQDQTGPLLALVQAIEAVRGVEIEINHGSRSSA
jgi:hypothetical protein